MIIIAASLYLPEHVTMMAKRAWFYYAGDETVTMTGPIGSGGAAAAAVVMEGLSSQGTTTITTATTTTTVTITGAAVTAAAVAGKVGLRADRVLDMLGEL